MGNSSKAEGAAAPSVRTRACAMQGSWALSLWDTTSTHTQSQPGPSREKKGQIWQNPATCSWLCKPRICLPRGATQREEAMLGAGAVEAGQPHAGKAQLTLPAPKMGTREIKCVWCC